MAIPLEFTLRLQLNIRIYPNPAISIMQDVVDTYIPAIWFEASGTVTEEVAGGLQQLLDLPTIMTFCGLATLVLCMFGLLFSLVSFCHKKKRKDFDKVKTKFDDEKDDNSVCPDGCEMNLLYTNTKVQVCQAWIHFILIKISTYYAYYIPYTQIVEIHCQSPTLKVLLSKLKKTFLILTADQL